MSTAPEYMWPPEMPANRLYRKAKETLVNRMRTSLIESLSASDQLPDRPRREVKHAKKMTLNNTEIYIRQSAETIRPIVAATWQYATSLKVQHVLQGEAEYRMYVPQKIIARSLNSMDGTIDAFDSVDRHIIADMMMAEFLKLQEKHDHISEYTGEEDVDEYMPLNVSIGELRALYDQILTGTLSER